MRLLAILAAMLASGAASDVDETRFRYTRTLSAPTGAPVRFEPDGPMYAHSGVDFPDLRIVDADGREAPWRLDPKPEPVERHPVPFVARGRQDGTVSVVVDRGAVRPVIDRLDLEIPDRTFVGTVVVQGSNTAAEGSYATLSATQIYAVRGAVDARSTTATFQATDYRYLLVRARGVKDISRILAFRDPFAPPLEPVAAEATRRDGERTTVVELDVGYPGLPVDSITIRSATQRYIRRVSVTGSNDGVQFVSLADTRIAHFPGVDLSNVALAARERYLRVTIHDGDDAPLERLRVTPTALPRDLLVAGDFRPPFRLLYGAPAVQEPTYDFRRLPAAATGSDRAQLGTLGPERANPGYEAPSDARTFFERYPNVVNGLLVLAALVAAAGGFFALRRRA